MKSSLISSEKNSKADLISKSDFAVTFSLQFHEKKINNCLAQIWELFVDFMKVESLMFCSFSFESGWMISVKRF